MMYASAHDLSLAVLLDLLLGCGGCVVMVIKMGMKDKFQQCSICGAPFKEQKQGGAVRTSINT